MQSMELKKLLSYTRQAVDDYKLIKEGDHIAVGISGGKDSLTLLYALAGLRRFYPKKFTLTAITVDLGYDSFDLTPIKQLCEELKVPYHIVKTRLHVSCFTATACRTKQSRDLRVRCAPKCAREHSMRRLRN